MKITPENRDDLIQLVTANFRSFGGGQGSSNNPIAIALQDSAPQFAAGVDIEDVVNFILDSANDNNIV